MADSRQGRAGPRGIGALFGLNAREWWLASASALLLFAAFPPIHLVAPSFLALVPLSVAVREARTPRRAARVGVVFGLLHYGLLLHWMVPALARLTATVPLVFATAVMLLALSQALACWMLSLLRRDCRVPLWCALPLVWTAVEWGIAHAPGTLAYPWLGLGTSLTGYPELVGVAELAGARGVTFWLALVNGLVAEAVPAGRHARRLRGGVGPARPWLAAALVVAAVPAAWGVWRARHLDLRPGPVVSTVRTTLRGGPGEVVSDLEALAAVDALLAAADGARAPSLVVLPEGTFRDGLDQPEVVAGLGDLSRRLGAPVLFGVVRAAERGAGRYNSAALAGPAGLLGDPYDKRRLVPWVERAPLAGVLPVEAGESPLRAGGAWTLFEVGGYRAGALICYEAAFAGAARALRRAGAGGAAQHHQRRMVCALGRLRHRAAGGAPGDARHRDAHRGRARGQSRARGFRRSHRPGARAVRRPGRGGSRPPGSMRPWRPPGTRASGMWRGRGPRQFCSCCSCLPAPAAGRLDRDHRPLARNRPLNALRAKSILRAPAPDRPRIAPCGRAGPSPIPQGRPGHRRAWRTE